MAQRFHTTFWCFLIYILFLQSTQNALKSIHYNTNYTHLQIYSTHECKYIDTDIYYLTHTRHYYDLHIYLQFHSTHRLIYYPHLYNTYIYVSFKFHRLHSLNLLFCSLLYVLSDKLTCLLISSTVDYSCSLISATNLVDTIFIHQILTSTLLYTFLGTSFDLHVCYVFHWNLSSGFQCPLGLFLFLLLLLYIVTVSSTQLSVNDSVDSISIHKNLRKPHFRFYYVIVISPILSQENFQIVYFIIPVLVKYIFDCCTLWRD